jgi:hypothetical protein
MIHCRSDLADAAKRIAKRLLPHSAYRMLQATRNPAGQGPKLLDTSAVPLPVSGTREGDTKMAPPPSSVDPDVTERSRFIGQAAIAAIRAAIGV